jgi:hypothetical protein
MASLAEIPTASPDPVPPFARAVGLDWHPQDSATKERQPNRDSQPD